MSYRELAKSLIDQIPDSKLFYAIAYLQGISVPDESPNAETLASMESSNTAAVPCLPEAPKSFLLN